MIGQQLHNRYLIKSLLGRKTGRRTFLAEDTKTGSMVVVKLVLFGPDFVWDDIKLFEREAQTLQNLKHSAIPKYLDSFEVETPLGNGFALVQTYIHAQSLKAWMDSGYRFSQTDLEAIARNLLDILDYLHQHNPPVIHRDIKPSNVLLTNQGNQKPGGVHLVDFGSVQTIPTSGTMTVVGTYGYMPPEQFGGRAKPASDLYSLGATLIYLATGQHPADLTQDDLQLVFTPQVALTEQFTQWLSQLTQASLAKRTTSASQAIHDLTHPQPAFSLVLPTDEPASSTPLMPASAALAFQASHKDFKIYSSNREIEIRCLPSRLNRDNPIASLLGSFLHFCFWAIFISISLGAGGFIFLIIAFIVWFSTSTSKKKQRALDKSKNININLQAHQDGITRLSLSSTYETKESEQYISYLPLYEISYSSFGDHITFYYNNVSTARTGQLSLYGTNEDMYWLCDALVQWDIPIKGNFRRFPQGDR